MSNPPIIGATIAFSKYPLADALRYLRDAGFAEAEITIFPDTPAAHFAFAEADEAAIGNVAAVVEQSGVRVVALNVGAGYSPDAQKLGRFERGVGNLCRLATRLGARIVTVACGAVAEGEDRAQGLAKIADCYARLAETAKEQFGVTLSVEAPHKKSISESMEQIRSYWAAMPADLHCTLDVAHVTYAGCPMADVIELLGRRIVHVHLRDAVAGNSLLDYGKGQVAFPAIFRMLGAADYTGRFSLEYVGGNTPEETVAKLVAGKAYLAR